MKDRDLFTKKLTLLFTVFRAEPTREMAEAYWTACQDLTEKEFVAGTDRALKECRFMPVPAEIISFAKGSSSVVPGWADSEYPE